MVKYYSHEELEGLANNLNKKYNAERLVCPSVIDPYELIDILEARLSLQYLSPDDSYIGATVFEDTVLPIWPSKPYYSGLMPEYKFFHENTIIIDKDLAESKSEQDFFRFCFTTVHEGFHLCRHRYYFQNETHIAVSGYEKYGINDTQSELDKIEAQANYAAAAFLMPRRVVYRTAKKMLDYRGKQLSFGYPIKEAIKEMGRLFGVNYTPMVYRLQNLKILDEYFDSTII